MPPAFGAKGTGLGTHAVYSEITFSYQNKKGQSLKLPFEELLSLHAGTEVHLIPQLNFSLDQVQILRNLFLTLTDHLNGTHPFSTFHAHNELTKIAGFSRGYFFRAFKKMFDISPVAYQQNIRIKAAKTLLKTTPLRCNEVAHRVGFTDVYFFHRVFKKHTGVTPNQFRGK